MTILNKGVFQFLQPAISDDFARRELNFLEVNVVDSQKAILTAGNAYLVKRVEITGAINAAPGKYYLHSSTVTSIIKVAKKSETFEICNEGIVGKDTFLSWDIFNHHFPSLDFLFKGPFGGAEKNKIGLSTKNLTKTLKGSPSSLFKIDFCNQSNFHPDEICCNSQIRMTFANEPNFTAIIMPVVIKW